MRAATRLAGALLPVVLAVPAAAAPVCRVVPDVRGDAGYHPLGALSDAPDVPGTPGDDLLSADVASDGRHLTVMWRMGQVRVPDTAAPMGRSYLLVFDVRDRGSWWVAARTYATGTQYFYGDFSEAIPVHTAPRVLGEARGRLDTARGLVVVDASAKAFAGGLRRGTYLTRLQAAVSRWVGQGLVPDITVAGEPIPVTGTGMSFDVASGDHYVVGQRSCLRPGL